MPGSTPPGVQAYQSSQQQTVPQIDLSEVHAKLDQALNNLHSFAARNAVLEKKVDLLSMVVTILGRGMYQKQGNADAVGFLTELGVPLPQ